MGVSGRKLKKVKKRNRKKSLGETRNFKTLAEY